MSVRPISRHFDGTEAQVRVYVVTLNGPVVYPNEVGVSSARIWEVGVRVVVLLTALVANVHYGQHCPGSELVLNAGAVLVGDGQLVMIHGQAGDVGNGDRSNGLCTVLHERLRVIQRHVAEANVGAERDVRTSVIHVVALDALVHRAEPAAHNRLAGAGQVVGESEPRAKRRPLRIHQTLWNARRLSGNADAVQVKLGAGKNGVRAGTQTRAGTGAAGISSRAIVWTTANVAIR